MSLETPPIKIKAHFDGKVFVPDVPVDLPVGTAIEAWAGLPIVRETLPANVFVRKPGSAKERGLELYMSDDFDEPLEDFKEYM